MADVSHRPGDISGHPDVSEMRDRYARVMETRGVAAVEELVILAGIYAAISGWTVHFSAAKPTLALSNLVVGIALAVLGLCMSMVPERSADLNFVVLFLGAWLIVSPWVVARSAGDRSDPQQRHHRRLRVPVLARRRRHADDKVP